MTDSVRLLTKEKIKYPEDYNPILEYWADMNNGLVVCKKIYGTYKKIVRDLKDNKSEFYYSNKRANHVIEFAENYCRHSKGKMGGKPVILETWEKAALATIFGFIDIEGNRKYRKAKLIVGKKNGKSLIASIVALYLLVADGEPGPEVYAIAPLSLDTNIMTTKSIKTMGTIQIGDKVFTPEGNASRVDYVSPVVITDTYKITFDDGSEIVATKNHPWEIEQLSSNGKNKSLCWKSKLVETKDIKIKYACRNATRIKCAKAPIMSKVNLPIEPYVLGVWLGDGRSNRGCVCGHIDDIEIPNTINKLGYNISYMKQQNNTVYYTVLGLRTALRENKLLDNKHIPEQYFFASIEQRIELLKGLMDTDGTCTKTGECRFAGICKPLSYGVYRLALSLGYKAHFRETNNDGYLVYIVSFKAYSDSGTVFNLSRKTARLRKTISAKSEYRYITNIEKIKSVPCKCISIESKEHLYCVGEQLITTHNTKKDQAKIIWSESKRMRNKSPSLRKRIKALINELSCELNDGSYKPVASDVDTLDGLNVHGAMMDEFHQWKNGKALYDIVADGVSAREQPLIFMTSTAGKIREDIYDDEYNDSEKTINGYEDPDGYHDERTISFIYEIDSRAEWTDESCWIKANPGLGTIKNLKTLREKVERAIHNPSMVKNLVCKEFNIRETVGESWLTFEELDNRETFDLKELKPRYGICGYDLSKTTDLSAAVVLFCVPNDERIYFLSMFWIPEDLLEKRVKADEIPYDIWRDQGLLRTCEGNRISYHDIVEWFIEVQNEHDIYLPYAGYDNWSAIYMVEEMQAKFGKSSQEPVIQGKKTLSGPMGNLGADIRSHRVVYNNNPCLKWNLTNVSVDSDVNNNIQPIKGKSTKRRIDGFAAMLNAYVVYERHKEEYHNMI